MLSQQPQTCGELLALPKQKWCWWNWEFQWRYLRELSYQTARWSFWCALYHLPQTNFISPSGLDSSSWLQIASSTPSKSISRPSDQWEALQSCFSRRILEEWYFRSDLKKWWKKFPLKQSIIRRQQFRSFPDSTQLSNIEQLFHREH